MSVKPKVGFALALFLMVAALTGCGTQVTKSVINGPIPDTLNRILISYTLTGMSADAQTAVGDELVRGLAACGVSAAILDRMARRSEVAQFDPEYELRIVWMQMQTTTSLRLGTSRDVTLGVSLFNYKTKAGLWTAELDYVDPGTVGGGFLARDFSNAILGRLKTDEILKNCAK